MKIIWQIDGDDVAKVQEFYRRHQDDAFVKMRSARNLAEDKQPITREAFWDAVVGCLLTTQQRSGPTSPAYRFISTKPFLLRRDVCLAETALGEFVTKMLREFGGLRRSSIIGREAQANWAILEDGGWQQTSEVLETVRSTSTAEAERQAARFLDDKFKGFGPKQSRNLLQKLGLSRFEVPIDGRLTKWLNEFGFPMHLTASALADRSYFEVVSDGFQQLALACGIAPCLLDAAIFSSFDGGGWTDENVVR